MKIQRLRTLAQSFANSFGYRFVKVKTAFVPKQLHFSDGPIQFDYWVSCIDSAAWYRPDTWAGDHEYTQLKKLVQPGDRVLEIGCNMGFTTMTLARFATDTGFVLGVDVVPDNVIVAQATVNLNNASNVRILHTAAGASQGEIGYLNQINGVMCDVASFKAPMTTCDDLDEKFGPFDVVKIDVEGYEKFVLQGAKRLLARTPKLALEVHGVEMEKFGSTIEQVLGLIDLEKYEGCIYARLPEPKLMPFEPGKLAGETYPILFLSPKKA